jgi:hypothetical protein
VRRLVKDLLSPVPRASQTGLASDLLSAETATIPDDRIRLPAGTLRASASATEESRRSVPAGIVWTIASARQDESACRLVGVLQARDLLPRGVHALLDPGGQFGDRHHPGRLAPPADARWGQGVFIDRDDGARRTPS